MQARRVLQSSAYSDSCNVICSSRCVRAICDFHARLSHPQSVPCKISAAHAPHEQPATASAASPSHAAHDAHTRFIPIAPSKQLLWRMQAIEALRRAKFKFAGRQKIIESRNWGFTHFQREHYVQWKAQGRLLNCGTHARVRLRAVPPPCLVGCVAVPPCPACVRGRTMTLEPRQRLGSQRSILKVHEARKCV